MVDLILTTFDWVPETPRGYVRDAKDAAGRCLRAPSGPAETHEIRRMSVVTWRSAARNVASYW